MSKIVWGKIRVKRIGVIFTTPQNGDRLIPAPLSPAVGPGRTFRENTGPTSYPTMFKPPLTLTTWPVM